MNVSLVIRFLTEGAEKVRTAVSSISTEVKAGFAAAGDELVKGLSAERLDAAMEASEKRIRAARERLLDAAAMAGALAAPVTLAAKFEDAFADLVKVLDEPVARLRELKRELLSMSGEISVSANDLTAIMAAAAQGGIPTDNLERFTAFAARAAVAFDMSAGEIGRRFAELRNVYRLDQEGIEGLADAANHLSNRMAARADQITAFVNRAGGAIRTLRLTATEMTAVGAALVAAGIAPETAARGLSGLSNRLAMGSDKVVEAFDAVGLSHDDFMASLDENAPAALTELFRTLSEAPNGMTALIDIVGQDFSDDFSKLLNNPDLLAEAFASVGDASAFAGSAVAEYEARAGTTLGKIGLLKNQVQGLGIVLGDTLLPALNGVVEAMSQIASGIQSFADAFPHLTGAVTGAGAALLAIGVATRVIAYVFELAHGGLLRLVNLFGRFANGTNVAAVAVALRKIGAGLVVLRALAVWAFNAIAAASAPVVAIVAAIAAALFAVWKYWDRISAFLSGFATGVADALSPVTEAVGDLVGALAGMLGIDLSGVGQAIGEVFGAIGDAIQSAVAAVGSFLGAIFSKENLTDAEKAEVAAAGEALGRVLVEAIPNGLAAAWGAVVAWFTARIDELSELLTFDIGFTWPEPPAWLKWLMERTGLGGEPEPTAQPAVPSGVTKPMYDFPRLMQSGAEDAADTVRDGAAAAGQQLGANASTQMQSSAATIGRLVGSAAASEFNRSVRAPATTFTPIPAGAGIGTARTGALHDGVD